MTANQMKRVPRVKCFLSLMAVLLVGLRQPATGAESASTVSATGESGSAPVPTQPDFTGLRGANYVPSYARNDVQLWMDYDAAVIDHELGHAKKLGLNCVRVFLQFSVYERDPKLFLHRFENFLRLCERHQIQMMPVLFDSCFGEFPDLERYRDKDWMACPGQHRLGTNEWAGLETYVRAVVGTHKDDKRIVMWDVMNEPFMTSFKAEADRRTISEFLTHFCVYVKGQKPIQPTCVGFAFSAETREWAQKVDVLAFHNYAGPDGLRTDIRAMKDFAAKVGKPVIINEVVMRPQQTFAGAMPVLEEEKIGWVFWELMLGKTQFSRDANPIQGIVYPDGTCRDAREIATVMNTSVEAARRFFPERPPPIIEKDGVTYRGFWVRWTGEGPLKNQLHYSNTAGATATLETSGQTMTLIHKVGPDCGIARVLIDGQPAPTPEIDTFSPSMEWNHRTVLAKALPAGRHAVTVEATGKKNAKSSDAYVQIVAFDSSNPLPLRKLMDTPLRDTSICVGPDGQYYLTGTTGHPTWWTNNEGIRLWRSADLTNWVPLGLVWSFEKDATWQKPVKEGHRAIWAPEVHFMKGTFWLAYCVNWPGGGTGLLKSSSGKAEGPYVDVKPDGPLTSEIDASLFQDDDGKVYFVFQDGRIARMKDDLTDLAEKPRLLKPANFKHVGFEGAFMTRMNGRYTLICAEFNERDGISAYDCMAASADSIYGPYGDRYLALPTAGHNMVFKDLNGHWWATYFGNDPQAAWLERPGLMPIQLDANGKIAIMTTPAQP